MQAKENVNIGAGVPGDLFDHLSHALREIPSSIIIDVVQKQLEVLGNTASHHAGGGGQWTGL